MLYDSWYLSVIAILNACSSSTRGVTLFQKVGEYQFSFRLEFCGGLDDRAPKARESRRREGGAKIFHYLVSKRRILVDI